MSSSKDTAAEAMFFFATLVVVALFWAMAFFVESRRKFQNWSENCDSGFETSVVDYTCEYRRSGKHRREICVANLDNGDKITSLTSKDLSKGMVFHYRQGGEYVPARDCREHFK